MKNGSTLGKNFLFNMNPEDYVPESNQIDFDEVLQSTNFKKKKYVDAIFLGETVGSKRHGKGAMIYKNGRLYEGDWSNDQRCGMGFEKY